MSQLSEFLDCIWGSEEGFVYIPVSTKQGEWKPIWAEWPKQKSNVVSYFEKMVAIQSETYMSPVLWSRKPEKDEQFGEHLFKLSNVLWAEFDGNAPETWPENSETPAPSIIIQSSLSGHQHFYWLLDEPITNAAELANKNRTIATTYEADNCWDATRVLRPPDTINYGYAKKERKGATYPVFIEQLSPDVKYSKDTFKQVTDFRPLVKDKLGDIPGLPEVLATQTWSETMWAKFNAQGEPGKRSDQLQEIAYFCAESGFSPEQTYAVLLDCDNRWEKYKYRTDRDRRLVDIIDRAISKYPFALSKMEFSGIVNAGQNETVTKSYYTFDEMRALDIRITWQVQGLLPTKGLGMIAGPTGVGKSQLAFRIGEAIATGRKFLFWPIVKTGKVLVLSLEMTDVEVKEFLDTMAPDFDDANKGQFIVAPVGTSLPLGRPESRKYLEDLLSEVQPTCLIIDSLSKVLPKFKDDDSTIEFNTYINYLRTKYNCSIIIIHHNRKSQDKKYPSDDVDDVYGSRFLTQDESFVMMVEKIKDMPGSITINMAKLRFTQEVGKQVVHRTKELNFVAEGELGVNESISQTRFSNVFTGLNFQ